MDCSHCAVPLVPEIYEGITIDRCSSCSGTWLDAGELTHIVETRDIVISSEIVSETLALGSVGLTSREARTFVACPNCQCLMNPLNYDFSSGIIIDHCPLCHGNWLDASELEKVQAHREGVAPHERELESDWLSYLRLLVGHGNEADPQARDAENGPTRYVFNRLLRTLLGK
jgi:Zn-finger nucleic acid-binding protein